jgi:hypothetical protein
MSDEPNIEEKDVFVSGDAIQGDTPITVKEDLEKREEE